MNKVLLSLVLAVLVSFSAAAIDVADVNVQPAYPGEWELLDIYEAIFGVSTGFATSDALYEAVGVDPDDYNGPDVLHFFGDQDVALEARYATYTHDLYFYDPVLPDAVANENFLFTVTGGYVNPGAGGSPSAVLTASVQPYGFSLHVGQTAPPCIRNTAGTKKSACRCSCSPRRTATCPARTCWRGKTGSTAIPGRLGLPGSRDHGTAHRSRTRLHRADGVGDCRAVAAWAA